MIRTLLLHVALAVEPTPAVSPVLVDGRMRSLQPADDLAAPSRQCFTLTRAEAARLEDRR